MKQLEINTGKATILAVWLPKEKAYELLKFQVQIGEAKIRANNEYYTIGSPNFKDNERFKWAIDTLNKKFREFIIDLGIDLPEGNWRMLSDLENITEEQAMSVMPEPTLECCGCGHPVTNQCCGNRIPVFESALDELKSILQSKGVITVNPHPKPELDFTYENELDRMRRYNHDLKLWSEAQSQLWENVLILKKDEK